MARPKFIICRCYFCGLRDTGIPLLAGQTPLKGILLMHHAKCYQDAIKDEISEEKFFIDLFEELGFKQIPPPSHTSTPAEYSSSSSLGKTSV